MSGIPKMQIGDKYGYLTIIEDSGRRDKNGNVIWKCQCDCGNLIFRRADVITRSLIMGCTISCGCKRDKSVGKRLAFDKNRIDKAREGLGQIDGTTMQGIDRKSMNKNNKSGVRGVCFKTREQKWQADITLRGKSVGRELFKTKEEAIKWRKYLEETYYEPIKEKYRQEQEEK